MGLSRHRKQTRWLLAIGLLSGLLVLSADWAGGFQRLEWITYDARVKALRSDEAIPDEFALILIDEASLAQLNPVLGRFPWPRSVYADLLEFLAMGNPRSVVFDILFTENQWESGARDGPSQEDRSLMMATAAMGNVHHAVQVFTEVPDESSAVLEATPLPESVVAQHALSAVEGVQDRGRNRFILPFDGLHQVSAGLGAVGLDADSDGVFRRVRPLFRYREAIFPGLSTTALVNRLGLDRASQTEGRLRIDGREVPLDGSGRMLANYYGEIPSYSIGGIFQSLLYLQRGEPERMLISPEEFQDRIVFIGGSAVGLHDVKHTPLSGRTPGVTIHMTAAGNLLTGDVLKPLGAAVSGVLIMLYALISAVGFRMGRVVLQLSLPLLFLFGHVAAAFLLFGGNWVLDMVAPVSSVLLSGLCCLAYVSATEGRDKRRVRRMLSQYVSPAVLAEVVDRYDEHIRAEVGTAEEMTILFSDIRGFTRISENYPPEEVVDLLNRYLSIQTDAILGHEGTLDKFIGDAIMAFWGAPIRVEDHARRAVLAAMEMQRRGRILNRELAVEGRPVLHTGIGVHTGSVVLGNIGSERKLDYTVIGDNVNLSSRIEGLTSQYRCPVLISDVTREQAGEDVICALVDRVRVKGKEKAIAIWRPLAGPGDEEEQRREAERIRTRTEEAWQHYRVREWDKALAAWATLPGDDPVRAIFEQRCRQFREQGVPAAWDGIHRLDKK